MVEKHGVRLAHFSGGVLQPRLFDKRKAQVRICLEPFLQPIVHAPVIRKAADNTLISTGIIGS